MAHIRNLGICAYRKFNAAKNFGGKGKIIREIINSDIAEISLPRACNFYTTDATKCLAASVKSEFARAPGVRSLAWPDPLRRLHFFDTQVQILYSTMF